VRIVEGREGVIVMQGNWLCGELVQEGVKLVVRLSESGGKVAGFEEGGAMANRFCMEHAQHY